MKKTTNPILEIILIIDFFVLIISVCCLDSASWVPIANTFISIAIFFVIGLILGIFAD